MSRTDPIVAQLRKQLEAGGRAWVRKKTLVELAGQKKASPPLLVEIEQALEKAGIYHSPGDLGSCRPTDTVFVSTEPFYDRGLPFSDERHLSDFIARHYRLLPPFRHCTSVKQEHRIRDLRIDLFFREADGDRIVCELEHSTGRHEAGSQIRSYVEAARTWAETAPGRPGIRGVVITGAPNPRQETMLAEWCEKSGEKVTWYYYRLGLELTASERLGSFMS